MTYWPESKVERRLMDALTNIGADPTKHSDKDKSGIPDISWGWGGRSWWAEIKVFKDGPHGLKHFTPHQRRWLQYRYQSAKHCFLVVGDPSPEGGELFIIPAIWDSMNLVYKQGRAAIEKEVMYNRIVNFQEVGVLEGSLPILLGGWSY